MTTTLSLFKWNSNITSKWKYYSDYDDDGELWGPTLCLLIWTLATVLLPDSNLFAYLYKGQCSTVHVGSEGSSTPKISRAYVCPRGIICSSAKQSRPLLYRHYCVSFRVPFC